MNEVTDPTEEPTTEPTEEPTTEPTEETNTKPTVNVDEETINHRVVTLADYTGIGPKNADGEYEYYYYASEEAVANDDPLKNDLEIAMIDAKEEMNKKENTMKYYQEVLAKAKYAFNTKGDYQSPAIIRIYDYEVQGKYILRIPSLGK